MCYILFLLFIYYLNYFDLEIPRKYFKVYPILFDTIKKNYNSLIILEQICFLLNIFCVNYFL